MSEKALQIAEKRREAKGKGKKKDMKIIEWGRLESSSRKLEIPREHCMQRWAQ